MNVLDGLDTPEGLITIITSNHKEILDRVLVRHGRIDVHVDFNLLDNQHIAKLVDKHYPGHEKEIYSRIVNDNQQNMQKSPAEIVGHVMSSENVEEVLDKITAN